MLNKLDENFYYWQISISARVRDKTCFKTHSGTYRYTEIQFRLSNAPATFQRALEISSSGLRWKICVDYLDDVNMFSPSTAQHVNDVEEILSPLKKAAVTLELNKCAFSKRKVD